MRNLNNKHSWRLQRIAALISIALLFLCQHASGYSDGADVSVCGTMIPGHGAQPQTSPNPYKVSMSKKAVMGFEPVDITLASKSGTDDFKGFIIQVRKPGGEAKAIGEFKVIDENNTRTLNCFGIQNSAMTHTTGNPKRSVTVKWIAPNDGDGEYQIYYSVVGQDGGTYWTHIPHDENIRVTRNAQVTATNAPVVMASEELLGKWREYYNGCGTSKGCFGMPNKCVENYDPESSEPTTCDIMVTWERRGSTDMFEITGRSGGPAGYVAAGWSTDQSMGQDSVVGCAITNSKATPTIERYYNPGRINEKHDNTKLGLTPTGAEQTEGNIFCRFQQQNHELGGININFDQNNYFLLLSKAPSASSNGLGKHQTGNDRSASPQSVHITDTIIMGASNNNWLIQLHGGLMVIAWLMCASTGMFTARYFKLTHTDFTPCGKAFWFTLHVFCMAATIFLTICGCILILIYKKGVVLEQTHPILGVVVVGLAIVQVIIAFFRPHPGTPTRPYFNWFHWAVGNSAHIVGIVCILFASELSLADLKRYGDENLWGWILLGIVLFHVLMHIVMSIHTLWADKQMDSNNKKRAMQPGPMKNNGLNSEAPGTGFRTFMLSLYLLVMAAGAIVLVCLVFWPKSDKNDDAPTS